MNVSKKISFALSFSLSFALAIALHLSPATAVAASSAPTIKLEFSTVPDARARAEDTRILYQEWYPRINDILFGSGHPLPYDELTVKFAQKPDYENVPAYALHGVIHVWYPYTISMPDSYSGMMIHELTHINQHYPNLPDDAVWVSEGIADYVRHKYFEKDITPLLNANRNGILTGYSSKQPYFLSLQSGKVNLTQKGYLNSYTVAATFLYWLEQRKNKDIVKNLNIAMSEEHYSVRLFQHFCGAPVELITISA